jgi:hypothetical protein
VTEASRSGKGARVCDDPAHPLVTAHGRRDRAWNEIDDDDCTATARQGRRVPPGPTREIDDCRPGRQRKASIDDPRGRRPTEFVAALGVADRPVCAVVARIDGAGHR